MCFFDWPLNLKKKRWKKRPSHENFTAAVPWSWHTWSLSFSRMNNNNLLTHYSYLLCLALACLVLTHSWFEHLLKSQNSWVNFASLEVKPASSFSSQTEEKNITAWWLTRPQCACLCKDLYLLIKSAYNFGVASLFYSGFFQSLIWIEYLASNFCSFITVEY